MKVLSLIGLLCSLTGGTTLAQQRPAPLAPAAKVQIPALTQGSGIIASTRYPGVYWTHNDRGVGDARLYAIRRDGTAVYPAGAKDQPGFELLGAFNRDWEDITADETGILYIGDIGNNDNARRDLAVYVVPEPNPYVSTSRSGSAQTVPLKRVPFAYPDQTEFPPPKERLNYDAEALFWADGKLHIITKRRADHRAALYRFDSMRADELNILTRLDSYDVNMLVTGADATPDGRRLAVIGYGQQAFAGQRMDVDTVWVFERQDKGPAWFHGKAWKKQFQARGPEAVCWDGPDDLLITNEDGDIFVLPFKSLEAVKP